MDLAAVLNHTQHADGALNVHTLQAHNQTVGIHLPHLPHFPHPHLPSHLPHLPHPHLPHLPHLPHPHLPKLPKLPVKAVNDFVGGLIGALVKDDHFDEIDKCLKNGPVLQKELTTAVTDFKNKDILKGMEIMGTVISQLPADLATC